MTRTRLASAALLAALALAVAGCQTTSGTGDPTTAPATSAPAADAKTVLAGTAQHFQTRSFTYSITAKTPDAGTTIAAGGSDPASKSRSLSVQQDADGTKVTIEYRIIGADRFFKVDGIPIFPAKFMKIDGSKLTGPNVDKSLTELEGPVGIAVMFTTIVDVQDAGGGKYTGTVDLTKSTNSMVIEPDALKDLGDKAKAVPFEATADGQGQLTSLTVTIDPATNTFEMTFSKWGEPVSISAPPAGDVVDAPPSVYEFFNA